MHLGVEAEQAAKDFLFFYYVYRPLNVCPGYPDCETCPQEYTKKSSLHIHTILFSTEILFLQYLVGIIVLIILQDHFSSEIYSDHCFQALAITASHDEHCAY